MKPLTFKEWKDYNAYLLLDEYKEEMSFDDVPLDWVADRYEAYLSKMIDVDDDYLYEMQRDMALENKIDELHDQMVDLIDKEGNT